MARSRRRPTGPVGRGSAKPWAARAMRRARPAGSRSASDVLTAPILPGGYDVRGQSGPAYAARVNPEAPFPRLTGTADVSVRPARPEDAAEVARVQVVTWRTAYRDVLPAP